MIHAHLNDAFQTAHVREHTMNLAVAQTVSVTRMETPVPARRPLIVGLGGSPRSGSSIEKALRIALAAATSYGAETALVAGPELHLPLYGTEDVSLVPAAVHMLDLLERCDGILLASPAYHGSISGLLKNALDYVETLRDAASPYLDGRAVGCIVCAHGWQATGTTLIAMRSIVHALRGWPTPMGAAINASVPFTDAHGSCTDASTNFQLETVARQVVEFAQMRIAAR